jgi:large subunit ribosomal protein L6e
MARKPHTPRNYLLPGGVSRYSRSAMYSRKALYKKKKIAVAAVKEKKPYFKLKEVKGDKNGGKRIVSLRKSPRFYPTEDINRKLRSSKKDRPLKLRASIVPGTVLILLAGHHMGRRVVFLRQLASGLLLVTGPYCVNGVPLRRVNQAYVIATKTTVDLGKLDIPARLDDNYFRRSRPKSKAGGGGIFAESKQRYSVSDVRKEDQRAVDQQLMPLIKSQPSLGQYLAHRFSLSHGQYPHQLIF